MKISANSIRTGNILVYNNDLWVVSKTPEHTQPGKDGACVQVEMKNLKVGTQRNERFSSSDYLEKAELEQKNYPFLYFKGGDLVLIDTKNFQQINVGKEISDEKLPFLTENMIIKVEFYNEKPLNIELPTTVILEIIETDPVIKGSTVTSSYKPAILANGIKVKVPQYLGIGEKIVVKTEDSTYVERAKQVYLKCHAVACPRCPEKQLRVLLVLIFLLDSVIKSRDGIYTGNNIQEINYNLH